MNQPKTSILIFLIAIIFVLAGCSIWQITQDVTAETPANPQTHFPNPHFLITDPNLVLTPGALTAPSVGSTVTDPVFDSTLRRLTNTGNSGFGTHIYSQLQAFSADNQHILLIEDGLYTVRRRDTLAQVPLDMSNWNTPRWHPTQASTLIHFDGNDDTTLRLQFTNVSTQQTSTVFTFPAPYERIRSNQSFDEVSRNGRFLAGMASLTGGDQMLFALDMNTMILGAQLRLSADLYAGRVRQIRSGAKWNQTGLACPH